MSARGNAVAGSESTYTPMTDGSPNCAGFPGCEFTHFTPAASPTRAGMARKSPPMSGMST